MKKIIPVFLTIVIFFVWYGVSADRKPPAAPLAVVSPSSWYGTYGTMGYPTLTQGYVYAAQLNYPFIQTGTYTLSDTAFFAPNALLTNISGTCFVNNDINMAFTANLTIDARYTIPLFDTHGSVAVFNMTVFGQSFVIKIATKLPIGCNVLLQAVQ